MSSEFVWSDDFIVVDTAVSASKVLKQLDKAKSQWVVLRHRDGVYLYAFALDELWQWKGLSEQRARKDLAKVRFESLLDLTDEIQSTRASSRIVLPEIDLSWRPTATAPSIQRYVEIDSNGQPRSVGSTLLETLAHRAERQPPQPGAGRLREIQESVRGTREGPRSGSTDRPDLPTAAPPHRATRSAPPAPGASRGLPPPSDTARASGVDDEGVAPQRFPSIEAKSPLAAGERVDLTIDLPRSATAETQGAVAIGSLATDWKTLNLDVLLACQQIDFEGDARGTITIRRNDDSIPVVISGRVRAGLAPGSPVTIMASFFDGTRFCGSALRALAVEGGGRPSATQPTAIGAFAAEPAAARPDVTIYITKAGTDEATGILRWQVVCERFDGLPPSLKAEIRLDGDPRSQAAKLFKEFAVLEPGQHRARIEGFGSRLWNLAPPMFHAVYWALVKRFPRALAIQFISDEPHMPWELMRPVSADESEIHPPLALKHSVARWISRYDGYMRNQVPNGGISTIAPKYASASRRLPRAELESRRLVDEFGATSIPATRRSVLDLLEDAQPPASISVLHFAGHGQFAPEIATESNIKLEDGSLAASEVERPEVRLGKACRTLVFFNACEVGAAGSVFGEVGGWADAFLGRQFGGFIAPLWSVDDEDAGTVASELLTGIVTQRQPIGEVLRAVRAKYGDKSPTFYSYLYYGDVTACIAA